MSEPDASLMPGGPAPGKRGRKQLRPDPGAGPVAAFAHRLCELKEAAGDPSYDRMRAEFGAAASKSALSSAARGQDLPSWETTWEFVRSLAVGVLGQDPETARREWCRRWERARDANAELRAPAVPAGSNGAPGDNAVEPAEAAEISPAEVDGSAGDNAVEPGKVAAPKAVPDAESKQARRTTRRPTVLAAVVVLAACVALGMYLLSGPGRPIPGDASVLMSETVPDGTAVKAGTSFVKTWEIRNVGLVRWTGRYLERSGGRIGDSECTAPKRVWMPTVERGRTVRVTVPVVAGRKPGRCKMIWKMVDENGELFFPDGGPVRPVFFDVFVVG